MRFTIALYASNRKFCSDFGQFLREQVPQVAQLQFDELTQLARILDLEDKVLLYFIAPNLTPEERTFLKSLNARYGHKVFSILCGVENHARDAWLLECFYFLEFPVTGRSIVRSIQYFRRKTSDDHQTGLKISYKGGLHQIKYSDILYCKGAGNYTQIALVSGKTVLATIQLQKLYVLLDGVQDFERIGKSYIINVFNIRRLSEQTVEFAGSGKLELNLSELYIKRLRSLLLGVPE